MAWGEQGIGLPHASLGLCSEADPDTVRVELTLKPKLLVNPETPPTPKVLCVCPRGGTQLGLGP